MSEPLRVYWAPGCSSCLRTKEFLNSRGIPFESINVHEREGGFDELRDLGFRSFPVIARGKEATLCQELRQVADFVGVNLDEEELPVLNPSALVAKIDLVLQATARFARQLSEEQLLQVFDGRKNRNFRGLACHIAYVARAFVDACDGGRLGLEYYILQPPRSVVTGEDVAAVLDEARLDLASWWQNPRSRLPDTVDTYWGQRPVLGVLERTTWHAAQHARQLEAALELMGVEPDGRLGEAELEGLPLPKNVFDDELPMGTESVAEQATSVSLQTIGPGLGLAPGSTSSDDIDLTSLDSIRGAIGKAAGSGEGL